MAHSNKDAETGRRCKKNLGGEIGMYMEDEEDFMEEKHNIKIGYEEYTEQMRHRVERTLKPIKFCRENMKKTLKNITTNVLLFIIVLPSFMAILIPFVERKDLNPLKVLSESMQMMFLCWIIRKSMEWPWNWQTEIVDVRRGLMAERRRERLNFEEKDQLVHKLSNYEKYAIFMCIIVTQLGAGLMVWYREFVDIEEPRKKLVFHNFNISVYLFICWCRILVMVACRFKKDSVIDEKRQLAKRKNQHFKTAEESPNAASGTGCKIGAGAYNRAMSIFSPRLMPQEIDTRYTPQIQIEKRNNNKYEYFHLVENMFKCQREELGKLVTSIKNLEKKLSPEHHSNYNRAIEFSSQCPNTDYDAKGDSMNAKDKENHNHNLLVLDKQKKKIVNCDDTPSFNEIKSSSTLSQSVSKDSLFEPLFEPNILWNDFLSPYSLSVNDNSQRQAKSPQKGNFNAKQRVSNLAEELKFRDNRHKLENENDSRKSSELNLTNLVKIILRLALNLIFKISILSFIRKPRLLKEIFYVELYPIIRMSVFCALDLTMNEIDNLKRTWKMFYESALWKRCKILMKFYIRGIKLTLDFLVFLSINIPVDILHFFSALLFLIPKAYYPLFAFPIFHRMPKKK